MRHFAIYQRPWPSRLAPRGTISETPREETPVEVITKKVTHKGLPVLDRKLAAAASASASAAKFKKSKKHARTEVEEEEVEEVEQPPTKRRKSELEPILLKAKVTKTYQSISKKHKRAPSSEPVEEESERTKRRRGRPRLSSPKRADPSVKLEDPAPETERSILSQPRAVNGRFGRKERARKAAESAANALAQRALAEGQGLDAEDARKLARYKRSNENLEELEEAPRKRVSTHATAAQHDEAGVQRVMPRPMSGFRGGRLFSNPNPLQYALHAWAAPLVLDDSSSSSDDEKQPETPDDADSLAAGIVTPEEEGSAYAAPAVMISRGPLTFKPSPFAYAKTRWNGRSLSHGQLSSAKKLAIAETKKAYLADEEVRTTLVLDEIH